MIPAGHLITPTTRRTIVRTGAKLAYTVPIVAMSQPMASRAAVVISRGLHSFAPPSYARLNDCPPGQHRYQAFVVDSRSFVPIKGARMEYCYPVPDGPSICGEFAYSDKNGFIESRCTNLRGGGIAVACLRADGSCYSQGSSDLPGPCTATLCPVHTADRIPPDGCAGGSFPLGDCGP